MSSLTEYINIPQTAEMIVKQSKGLIPPNQMDLVSLKLKELINQKFSSKNTGSTYYL
jgi:hypothetical protein